MSFFKKIKPGLGIETVKLTLDVPVSISAESGQIEGQVHITAESDQRILALKYKLLEEFSTGRGDEKEERKSGIQELSEKKRALGALGKAAAFASAENSEYEIEVDAKIEGTMLNPRESKSIEIA